MTSRRLTSEISLLGTSMPTYPLPGTGVCRRMEGAASASAKSSARAPILLTFTRVRLPPRTSTKSGSTPNSVMVGPRLTSTTRTGAPKEASVSSIRRARWRSKSSLGEDSTPGLSICVTSGRFHGGNSGTPMTRDGRSGAGSWAARAVRGLAGGSSARAEAASDAGTSGVAASAARDGADGEGMDDEGCDIRSRKPVRRTPIRRPARARARKISVREMRSARISPTRNQAANTKIVPGQSRSRSNATSINAPA